MNPPKLVILDLDGTVVGFDRTHVAPSPAMIKALASVTAAGIPLAIATGRTLWDALRTVRELGLTEGIVSATHGAVAYDLATETIIDRQMIDPRPAVESLLSANPEAAFAVELDLRGWRSTENFSRDFHTTWVDTVDVETLADTKTVRLSVRVPGGTTYGTALYCPVATKLANDANLDESQYHAEVGFGGWVDIGPAGVTKASGAALVAGHYGVAAADTAVFGDASNDLPMFAWAGHAIAMGQAVDEVKAAADEVAPSVQEDGVAVMLNRWFG